MFFLHVYAQEPLACASRVAVPALCVFLCLYYHLSGNNVWFYMFKLIELLSGFNL